MRFAIHIVAAAMLINSFAPAAEKMYSMGPDRGVLVLNVPDDWDDLSSKPRSGSDRAATIDFSLDETKNAPPFRMSITPIPPRSRREGGPMSTQPAMLKTLTRRMIEHSVKPPVDKHLKPIEGKSMHGYWFDLTEGCGGTIAVDDVILTVEVRHGADSSATKLAREMLAGARLDKSPRAEAAAVAPAIDPAQRRLESFDGTWDLVLNAPGVPTHHDVTFRHRKIRDFMATDWRGLDVLVRFEAAANPEAGDDAEAARKYFESQQKQGKPETRPSLEIEDGRRARVEPIGTFRRRGGSNAHQSRNLYLARGGVWVSVWVSAPASDPWIKWMEDVIASVHIEPHPAGKSTTAPTVGSK